MTRKTFLPLVALFSFLFICTGVSAQPPAPGYWYPRPGPDYLNYVVLKGGIFSPEGDLKRMDTGFNGELAYGFRLTRNVTLEYSAGYFDTSGSARGPFARSGLSFHGDVYAIPLTFTLKLVLPINYCWELYGLGGGGGYYVHSRGTFTDTAGSLHRSDDNIVAGGFLGAGVTWNFTREFFLGLEGKYLWTSTAHLNVDIGQQTFHPNFTLEGAQGTVNIGYRF